MIRVFFDANVIVAASASSSGAARVIIRLADKRGDITVIATEYAWDEAERNLQQHKPEALSEFYKLKESIGILPEPSDGLVADVAASLTRKKRLPNKDLPILAGAISASADWLLTHDGDHFGSFYDETVLGVEVLRPGTALERLLRLPEDNS